MQLVGVIYKAVSILSQLSYGGAKFFFYRKNKKNKGLSVNVDSFSIHKFYVCGWWGPGNSKQKIIDDISVHAACTRGILYACTRGTSYACLVHLLVQVMYIGITVETYSKSKVS